MSQSTKSAKDDASPYYGFGEQAKRVFSDKGNLAAILAATAGSGLLGGYLTSKSPERAGETPQQRRKRILSNALLAAGAGGVGSSAALYGYNTLFNQPIAGPGIGSRVLDAIPGSAKAYGSAMGIGGAVGNRLGARADKKMMLKTITPSGMTAEQLAADLSHAAPFSVRNKAITSVSNHLYPNRLNGLVNQADIDFANAAAAANVERFAHAAGLDSNLKLKDALASKLRRQFVTETPGAAVAGLSRRGRYTGIGAGLGGLALGLGQLGLNVARDQLDY